MKRVLFVDHVERILGGAEINLIELLTEASRFQNWTLACACPRDSQLSRALKSVAIPQYDYRLPAAAGELRVVGRRFSVRNSLLGWRALSSASRTLKKIRLDFRADVIISCTNKDHFSAVAAGEGAPRAASIWWVNDIVSPDFFSKPARLAFALKARRAARLVAVSDYAGQALVREGVKAKRVTTIHNGIPVERYGGGRRGNWRAAQGLPAAGPLIGMIGRFTRWKGQEFFLRVAAAWVDRNPEGHFVLVGQAFNEEQAFEDELRRFVRDRGLDARLHFAPFQADIGPVLADLDVLVHASIRPEPFGRVVIEAMAAGVPVIAARAGGVPEIITDGVDGLLAEPAGLDSYVESLQRLLGSRGLAARVSAAARRTVTERFTVGRVRERFEQVVADVS